MSTEASKHSKRLRFKALKDARRPVTRGAAIVRRRLGGVDELWGVVGIQVNGTAEDTEATQLDLSYHVTSAAPTSLRQVCDPTVTRGRGGSLLAGRVQRGLKTDREPDCWPTRPQGRRPYSWCD